MKDIFSVNKVSILVSRLLRVPCLLDQECSFVYKHLLTKYFLSLSPTFHESYFSVIVDLFLSLTRFFRTISNVTKPEHPGQPGKIYPLYVVLSVLAAAKIPIL